MSIAIVQNLQINGNLTSDKTNGDSWKNKTMEISSIVDKTFYKWKFMEIDDL